MEKLLEKNKISILCNRDKYSYGYVLSEEDIELLLLGRFVDISDKVGYTCVIRYNDVLKDFERYEV